MPTYTYKCTTCTHEWDEQRSVDQRDSDSSCPVCLNPYIIRKLHATPVTFKGSGFYTTDKRK